MCVCVRECVCLSCYDVKRPTGDRRVNSYPIYQIITHLKSKGGKRLPNSPAHTQRVLAVRNPDLKVHLKGIISIPHS